MENLDTLQKFLKDHLKAKNEKFLLVLDDVWLGKSEDTNPFDTLLIPFNEVGNMRSRVLITTRTEKTTLLIGVRAENSIHLAELSSDDCWSIIKHHVFGDAGKVITNPELIRVGNQIVDKLKKSPLAANMVGVQLRNRADVNEWRKILTGDILKNTMETLLWSYKRLSANLQQCFAFCSLFPKGWYFDSNKMVKYWIANGFVEVPSGSSLTLEDQGHQYLNDLLMFSFFKYDANDGYPLYFIHDLLHDLAEDVSKGHCYRVDGDEYKHIPETIIHLSIDAEKLVTHIPAIANLLNLRTFIIIKSLYINIIEEQSIIFEKLTKLRVLNFGAASVEELHKFIGKLKHLQLLFLYDVNKLPESLGRLYHLKYLEISDQMNISSENVPKSLKNLINLRRANKLLVFNIREWGKLTSLHTLPHYEATKKRGYGIEQLKNLRELRGSLEISCLENVKSEQEAAEARLKGKKYLDRLELKWTGDSSEGNGRTDTEVLGGLEPPPNIKKLDISEWKGDVSPNWMLRGQSCLVNLQHLVLSNCSKWKDLPPLGQLPSLNSLKIQGAIAVEEVGFGFYGAGSSNTMFPNLMSLEFSGMNNWIQWSVPLAVEGVQVFPCLSELILRDCLKLKGIPFLPPSLCVLKIWGCDSLMQAPSLPHSLSDLEIGESLTSLVLGDHLKALLSLRIVRCLNLRSVEGIGSLPALKSLYIENCPMLVMSMEPVVYHVCCERVHIGGCPNLSFGRMRSAEVVVYRRSSIKSLTIDDPSLLEEMSRDLTSLSQLTIQNCESLPSLRVSLLNNHFSSLETLNIWFCPELKSLPEPENLSSLKLLSIWDCPELESLPELENLPSLKWLSILKCHKLESLPELGNLSSLKELTIGSCVKLESLPNLTNLSSLENLRIGNCKQIKVKYSKGGPRHHEVVHIPTLDFEISTTEIVTRVKELFKGHRELILGFNTFLPKDSDKEIEEAMDFIKKVKNRFQADDGIYKSFLEVLKMYKMGSNSVCEVYMEVANLFKNHDDLFEGFKQFLPVT